MKKRWMMTGLLGGSLVLGEPLMAEPAQIQKPSQDEAGGDGVVIPVPQAAEAPAAKPQTPRVELAIPPAVAALGTPSLMKFPGGIQMAITATTEKAQVHVNQGMNHLHGGWEFEASRHFAAAMREDSECLLAHWGMLMSLLSPSPEVDHARVAVTARLLDLMDAGKGTPLERGYCYGLVKYLEAGPMGGAGAFRKVAAEFPNDLQSGIFAALFSRGGFDEIGAPTPDQELAENTLLALIKKHPESTVPLNALLSIRADGARLEDSLELAETLARKSPDYPPYAQLLGHYRWRCGHHREAIVAFERASSGFFDWVVKNDATVADCPEWLKSECYRSVALASVGNFEASLTLAREISATPIPKKRDSSPGARFLWWDGKTLPARVLMLRAGPKDAADALASLPKLEEMKSMHGKSLAFWWIDGLRFALEAQRLIGEKNLSGARDVSVAMSQHGETLSHAQKTANQIGERFYLNRGFRALEILASEVRGSLAMAGPKERRGVAYNWFSAAVDRQRSSEMMFPPMILTPMRIHLGKFYLSEGRVPEAVEAYTQALLSFPNDRQVLQGLKTAYEAANSLDEAAATQLKIEALLKE